MALKGKNFGQLENWHRYWIIGTGAIFKRYWPARLKRAKPAIKLHLTISLKPPKWLY
ncbi:putative dNA-damage-inducible protein D [Escherichia coli MP021017.11]|nr:putative dNA-damage-inducible protein D [Escherichia coli MP021017.11]